jgi:hypothetical protein
VHRDLKLENLLLVKKKDISHIKIAGGQAAARFWLGGSTQKSSMAAIKLDPGLAAAQFQHGGDQARFWLGGSTALAGWQHEAQHKQPSERSGGRSRGAAET